jgi:hypothetical protein
MPLSPPGAVWTRHRRIQPFLPQIAQIFWGWFSGGPRSGRGASVQRAPRGETR